MTHAYNRIKALWEEGKSVAVMTQETSKSYAQVYQILRKVKQDIPPSRM